MTKRAREDEKGTDLTKLVVTATIKEAPFRVCVGDLTGMQVRRFREVTGAGIMECILGGMDLDRFAALVWVVKNGTRGKLRYEDVAAKLTYADFETIDIEGADWDSFDDDEDDVPDGDGPDDADVTGDPTDPE